MGSRKKFNLIKWLDGKKTIIGSIASLVIGWAFNQAYIDSNTHFMLLGVNSVWTATGIVHKVVKTKRLNQEIEESI